MVSSGYFFHTFLTVQMKDNLEFLQEKSKLATMERRIRDLTRMISSQDTNDNAKLDDLVSHVFPLCTQQ